MIFQNLFHQSERSEKPSEEMEVGEKRPAAFHDWHGSSLSGQVLGHHVYLTEGLSFDERHLAGREYCCSGGGAKTAEEIQAAHAAENQVVSHGGTEIN